MAVNAANIPLLSDINSVNWLQLVATGVGEADGDGRVRLCDAVIRSSDMSPSPEAFLGAGSGPRRVPPEPPPRVCAADAAQRCLNGAWGSSVAPCDHSEGVIRGGHLSLSTSPSFTMLGKGGTELELKFFKVS